MRGEEERKIIEISQKSNGYNNNNVKKKTKKLLINKKYLSLENEN